MDWDIRKEEKVNITIQVAPWVADHVKALSKYRGVIEPVCAGDLLVEGIYQHLAIDLANAILRQAIQANAEEMILIPLEDSIEMRYRIGEEWKTVACKTPDGKQDIEIGHWPMIARRFENVGIGQLRKTRWPVSIKLESRPYDLFLSYGEESDARGNKSLRFEIQEKQL